MIRLLRTVRKYHGGGLGDMADRGIPKAQVEIYLRSRDGETFYVPTLAEGILHLLSTEGYRLGISYWPDGAGFHHPEYKITIWRFGNELQCDVFAPMLDGWKPSDQTGILHWKLDYEDRLPNAEGSIDVVDLGTIIGLTDDSEAAQADPEDSDEFVDRLEATLGIPGAASQAESTLFEESEVVIDGSQLYFE